MSSDGQLSVFHRCCLLRCGVSAPLYLLAALLCAGTYSFLLQGRKALKQMAWMLPLLLVIALINPLFNTRGERILFLIFGRPYTLEALLYGFAVGVTLLITLLWFGCYNHVMTEDKFTALLGNLAPSLSLLLVMVLRLIPNIIAKTKYFFTVFSPYILKVYVPVISATACFTSMSVMSSILS